MKKIIVNLLSNRFGIVLAALNLCYFAGKLFVLADLPRNISGKIFLSLNIPALISSSLLYEILRNFLPELSYDNRFYVRSGFVTVCIVFQWLFIAWIAKTIAQKFTQRNSEI